MSTWMQKSLPMLAFLVAAGAACADQTVLSGFDGGNLYSNPDTAATQSTGPVTSSTVDADASTQGNMVFPTISTDAWRYFAPDKTSTMTIENGAARIDMKSITVEDWKYQIGQQNLAFKEGQAYKLSFRAKADAARPISVNAQIVGGDWHDIGFGAQPDLTTDWQSFSYTFSPKNVTDNAQLVFMVGQKPGTVWITDVVLTPVDASTAIAIPKTATRVDIASTVGGLYDVQLSSKTLSITNGKTYRITFTAKSSTMRQADAALRITQPDWHKVGDYQSGFLAGPIWRSYSFTVKATQSGGSDNVLAFALGPAKGSVWLADVQVVQAN
ncbi:MAG: carbohydrate binding domain-containing protein [Capsulimonadaceae bacterium]|nr:carbohydrate binding domain-containing protein [Capsulimonadaceae bacterium]